MAKKPTFLDSPDWKSITQTVKSVMVSDGTMSTLLDFERVLDEADVYAFKNWKLGELVDGPQVSKYRVSCTFMWPKALMPDPRAGKRLLAVGCEIKFKKTSIKMPVKIKDANDFAPGGHMAKLIDRDVWLVNITMSKQLMNDISEGSMDLAGQNIDLEDLEDAYAKDYDKAEVKDEGGSESGMDDLSMGGDMGGGMPPPAPGGGMV